MVLRCTSFKELSEDIKLHNKIILMFGAGAIGQVTTPEILKNLGLIDSVDCYLDNNKSIWGEKISACGRDFGVKSPQYLNACPADTDHFFSKIRKGNCSR